MLYQVDYRITKGTRYLSTGEYSRVIEAKNKEDAETKFKEYIGTCEYTILEFDQL